MSSLPFTPPHPPLLDSSKIEYQTANLLLCFRTRLRQRLQTSLMILSPLRMDRLPLGTPGFPKNPSKLRPFR